MAIQIPRKLEFLLRVPLGGVRYRIAYGGRGSAKSWNFARALLVRAAESKLRILCAREYQSSIKDSVHRLLEEQADAIGLGRFFDVGKSEIVGRNGSEFLFHGIKRDPHTIKSMEGIDICWTEEAEAISDKSWEVLIPTIRKPNSEIWISFNPALETDPTWKRFVETPPRRAIVQPIGYKDNPWCPEVLLEEARELRRRDPEAYENVWGGKPWRRSDAEVLGGRWRIEEFEPGEDWVGPYYGADWGFASDPAVLVRLWIFANRLWIEYDERGVGLTLDDLERRWDRVPGSREYKVRSDSARPETIHEMKLRGFKTEGAPKWAGSVEDGIEYLRTFEEILLHPRCKGWIAEARLWRYKTDPKTGDVLPVLIDANNHGPDATRYALAPLIRKSQANRRRGRVWFPSMEENERREGANGRIRKGVSAGSRSGEANDPGDEKHERGKRNRAPLPGL